MIIRLALLIGLALPLAARAQDDPAAVPVAALNSALATLEKSSGMPFPKRYALLAPVVDKTFNLQRLLQTIVGLKWADIAPADQAQLLTVFRAFTICNYVSAFNADSGDHFTLLPGSHVVGPNTLVPTQIVPKEGDPMRIDYVMRPGDAGWQAIDVLQAGTISQAAVQRSDFRGQLEAGGAAKLIASLRAKVHDLSGGTVTP
jgi:phospholipid transport system substrate-binding protein